jgi:hypothetical protein
MLAMRTNRAYATIRTPLKQVETKGDVKGGFVPDVEHRFFQEDVPFGLVILRDIADIMKVKTPFIDEILLWCQGLMGKEYLVAATGKLNGRDMKETGAATVYGARAITDLVSSTKNTVTSSKGQPRSKL